MKVYKYKGYDDSGGRSTGVVKAKGRIEAAEIVRARGLLCTEIKEEQKTKLPFFSDQRKVTLDELEFFTSELSLLLKSGVRIDKSIEILEENIESEALGSLFYHISQQLHSGSTLAEALRLQPETFSPLYVNLVEVGESTGDLASVFERLATDLKFQQSLKQKIITSLTYPFVIFCICVLSVFFIFNFIIPRMSTMFDSIETLPWYTEALLGVSEWINQYQVFLLFVLIGLGVVIKYALRVDRWRYAVQSLMLSLPVASSAVTLLERIRFNNALSLTLSAGLSVDRALSQALNSVSNVSIRKQIAIAIDKVKAGNSLAKSFNGVSIYSSFHISLIEVGESSGNLSLVFSEITTRSRNEFERWTQRITAFIEPVMIVVMGVLVGGIVITMLLSMVSVNEFSF
ncbi:type II secretion system F family protein [Alteromonas facilis]|uniref:type II secretion system F family protein n=1 Tax=Alteromonas facilis TaxID=2048004 RepID=UPI000C28DBBF|nr:type II secretion system F family protein [Alteromonas facilis]